MVMVPSGFSRIFNPATKSFGSGTCARTLLAISKSAALPAERNRSAVARFLAATRQAKEILAGSEAEWLRLAPRIRASDDNALAIYRRRYGEGIVQRPLAEEEADARALYVILAEIGGAELVGPARELAAGTFYRPAAEH